MNKESLIYLRVIVGSLIEIINLMKFILDPFSRSNFALMISLAINSLLILHPKNNFNLQIVS